MTGSKNTDNIAPTKSINLFFLNLYGIMEGGTVFSKANQAWWLPWYFLNKYKTLDAVQTLTVSCLIVNLIEHKQ